MASITDSNTASLANATVPTPSVSGSSDSQLTIDTGFASWSYDKIAQLVYTTL